MALNAHKSKWPLTPLCEVAEINPKRPIELRKLDDKTPVSFVPMAAVCEWTGTIKYRITRQFGEVKKGFTYFADGDVIFAKITPCMQNGKSAVATGLANRLGFGSTEFHVLRPTRAEADWIYFFLRRQAFRDEASRHFQGSAGQQRVPEDFLSQALIPNPPKNEQSRMIARIQECLRRVEEMDGLREIAAAETPLIHERFLAEVENSMEGCSVPLGEVLAETKNGKSLQNKEVLHNGKALTLSAVRTLCLDMSASKSVQINAERDDNYLVRPGDVLISRSNTRELVALSAIAPDHIDEPTIFSDLLIRLTPKPKAIRPLYLTIALRMPGVRHQLRANAIGSSQTMVKISGERLRTVEVPCPSPEEQERIEAKYTEVASVTASISAELEEQTKDMNAFREAVLREAFAGKL